MSKTPFELDKIKETLASRAWHGGAEKMEVLETDAENRTVLVKFMYKFDYKEYAVYKITNEGLLNLLVETAIAEYARSYFDSKQNNQ